MKGNGQVSINLVQRTEPDGLNGVGHSECYIIDVQDERSGVEFLHLEFSLEDFARALSGRFVDCEFELRPENVGKIRETKIEHVFVPNGTGKFQTREELLEWCVEKFNLDGWVGRVRDVRNMHCVVEYQNEGTVYSVLYTRFADDE